MIHKRKPRRTNPVARALRTPLFRARRVKSIKGTYSRRPKHRGGGFDSVSGLMSRIGAASGVAAQTSKLYASSPKNREP